MSQTILNPFTPYLDASGQPLQDGLLYIGVAGKIAEAAPLTVYWDRALTQPAAQPLNLTNGLVTYAGAPANIFFSASDYSMSLKNKNKAPIFTILSALATGYTDNVITVPPLPVSTDNIVQNSNFEYNTGNVSGSVVLLAGEIGHDLWKAGAGGCTYSFNTLLGVTTITITAGTLLQIVPGSSIFSQIYWLSWTGTSQARISTGSYGVSRSVSLTGGVDIPIEFGAGTVSKVQLIVSTSDIVWKPSNNIYRSDLILQSLQPNLILNSQFTVNLDNYTYSGTSIVLIPNAQCFDMWKAGPAGCTLNIIQPSVTGSWYGINITAGSLIQTVENGGDLRQSGVYTLSWQGTALCKINTVNYSSNAKLGLVIGGGDIQLEWLPGTMWNPSLTLGSNNQIFVPETITLAALRTARYRQQIFINRVVYGSAGMSSGHTVHLPVIMRAPPNVVFQIAPVYGNGSGFTVAIANSYVREAWTVTALGVSQVLATYLLDATL